MKTVNINVEEKWYALYTRRNWEKKVAETLTNKKIENYCPLNKVVRQWSDRKKIILEPLFTSYVFVRTTEKMHSEIRELNGVLNFVYWLHKPAIIRNEEIICIKDFLNDFSNVQLQQTVVGVNDTVKITSGALADYEGKVISLKSKTIKIILPSLGYMLVAEVEKTNIKLINKANDYQIHNALINGC